MSDETPIDVEMRIAIGPCPFDPSCGCKSGEDPDANECGCWHHGLSTMKQDLEQLRSERDRLDGLLKHEITRNVRVQSAMLEARAERDKFLAVVEAAQEYDAALSERGEMQRGKTVATWGNQGRCYRASDAVRNALHVVFGNEER